MIWHMVVVVGFYCPSPHKRLHVEQCYVQRYRAEQRLNDVLYSGRIEILQDLYQLEIALLTLKFARCYAYCGGCGKIAAAVDFRIDADVVAEDVDDAINSNDDSSESSKHDRRLNESMALLQLFVIAINYVELIEVSTTVVKSARPKAS